jgi:hypothetical protein
MTDSEQEPGTKGLKECSMKSALIPSDVSLMERE